VIELIDDGARARVRVSGDWTFDSLREHAARLAEQAEQLQRRAPGNLEWDLSAIDELDDAGAVWLVRNMRGARPAEVPARYRGHLETATAALGAPPLRGGGFDAALPVLWVGGFGLRFLDHLRDGIALLGRVALDALRLARRPRDIPMFEISANIYRSGVTALPVTMLVGFLVGVVLTYLSALQLKKYGADLLVIDIVAIGVLRELGPMLASIISAGRSGSTMTAQLGVMRVTEEIEALAVMGISVTSRLVLPKVIGLACALPLVAFATDLAALAGGMLIAKVTLGIEYAVFLERIPRVVDVANFWIGIGKSAVFGFAVAFVACHYGLRVLPNTESLGAGVTRSVVASITSVILLDAIFAILLRNIG